MWVDGFLEAIWRSSLAPKSQAHFLAVAEHGLVPARARNVITQLRQGHFLRLGPFVPGCHCWGVMQEGGVASRCGASLSLPTIVAFLKNTIG